MNNSKNKIDYENFIKNNTICILNTPHISPSVIGIINSDNFIIGFYFNNYQHLNYELHKIYIESWNRRHVKNANNIETNFYNFYLTTINYNI